MQCASSEQTESISKLDDCSEEQPTNEATNSDSQIEVVPTMSASESGTVVVVSSDVFPQNFSDVIEFLAQRGISEVSVVDWHYSTENDAKVSSIQEPPVAISDQKNNLLKPQSALPSSSNNRVSSKFLELKKASNIKKSCTASKPLIGEIKYVPQSDTSKHHRNMASGNDAVKPSTAIKENTPRFTKHKLTMEEYRKMTGLSVLPSRKADSHTSKGLTVAAASSTTNSAPNDPKINEGRTVVDSRKGMEVGLGSHYVVCCFCGYSSYNLEKCGRCQRKVTGDWIVVRNVPASSSSVSTTTQEICPHVSTIRCTSSESYSENRRTVVVKRQTRQNDEPPCLTISSDDEDGKSSKPMPTGKSIIVETPIRSEVDPRVDLQDPANVPNVTKEDLAAKSLEEILAPELQSQPYVALRCRCVRFGAYKVVLTDLVFFTEDTIFAKILQCGGEEHQLVWVAKTELTCIDACFSSGSPIAFIRCSLDCSNRIMKQLCIKTPDTEHRGEQDNLKCFIVMVSEHVTESVQLSLKQMYGDKLRQISDRAAQDQLLAMTGADQVARVKYERKVTMKRPEGVASPTHKSTSESPRLENAASREEDNSTWLVWPPPPSREGISITGQDYRCLEPDTFLNDVIIDFYLKYLMNSVLSVVEREKTHVFSCFFYQRLTTRPKGSRKKHPIEDNPMLTAAEKRHHRVKSWTKNVDIFSKDFLIVPINESSHWFLAIVCFPGLVGTALASNGKEIVTKSALSSPKRLLEAPALLSYNLSRGQTLVIGATSITPVLGTSLTPSRGSQTFCLTLASEERDEAISEEEEEEELLKVADSLAPKVEAEPIKSEAIPPENPSIPAIKQPCILVFDSMKGCSRSRVIATLRDYLQVEYNVRKKDADLKGFNKDTIRGVNARVPQQTNSSDCGIYVLEYVESFFKNPIKSFRFPLADLREWFTSEEVGMKRQQLQELIVRLIKEVNPDFVLRCSQDINVSTSHAVGKAEEVLANNSAIITNDVTMVSETAPEPGVALDQSKTNLIETEVNGEKEAEMDTLDSGKVSPVFHKQSMIMGRKRNAKLGRENNDENAEGQATSVAVSLRNGSDSEHPLSVKKHKADS